MKLRVPGWAPLIPDSQWALYRQAIKALRITQLPFMVGGGFGLAAYISRWRNTKDIDFYILPEHRELFARALADEGFADYYSQLPYDRGWIYRSAREGVIVDIIWSMANRRAQVEASWFEHANSLVLREETLKIIPVEELLWCKLYVLQRQLCDWSDVFNLLYAAGPMLDWSRLLGLVSPDTQLLKAALTLFNWICPSRCAQFPAGIRKKLQIVTKAGIAPSEEQRRVRLLDTRAWFGPLVPRDKPLEV